MQHNQNGTAMILSAMSDGLQQPVDWWFIYKLPRGIGPGRNTTGDEFLYCDSSWNSAVHLSKFLLNDHHNALTATLKPLFSSDSSAGYLLWNDEIPPSRTDSKPANNHLRGHSKGVLAFSKKTNSGFYLLHSTPRFPAVGEIELPDDEREYGQTFLCVTLNYATTLDIAEILRLHHEPQVYACNNLPADAESPLVRLAQHDHRPLKPNHPLCVDYKFRSRERNEFRLLAKHKKWSEPAQGDRRGKDFWNHLVGPALRDNMDVETWRRRGSL